MKLREARPADAAAIAAIYTQGIEDRGATFETAPRSAADVSPWLSETDRWPVVIAEDESGRVMGWASARPYRPRACYAGIAEFSVYIDRAARGRGVGRALIERLVEEARNRGLWKLVSRVFAHNQASRALCRAAGFREVGVYEKHGRLDGKWIDVIIFERVITENLDEGYVPPDPDEAPPVELWSSVGSVRPWNTMVLLFVWAALFGVVVLRGGLENRDVLYAWGGNASGLPPLEVAWRLLASTLLHAGPAHLFFNATAMLLFGPTVERVFTRWGFWVVYGGGGAIASLASLAWRSARADGGASLSVGASGAIFALGGASLVAAYRLRHTLAVGRARAMGAALLYLVAGGLVSGFTRDGTDNVAHAAGLGAGVIAGLLLGITPRLGGRGSDFVTRALAIVAVLALLASLGLAVRSGLSRG